MSYCKSPILAVVCLLSCMSLVANSACTETERPLAPSPTREPQNPAPAETGKPVAATSQLPVAPFGLPPVPVPPDNPMNAAKVELGKMLYFDKRLSKDGTVSCASCHDPKMGWTEGHATSEGIRGQAGDRNSPTVINAAYLRVVFWDGRARDLEEQALGPIENPIEMGHKLDAMIADLSKLDGYRKVFKEAFGSEAITKENVAKAISAFQRTVLSGDSPYDRAEAGDKKALSGKYPIIEAPKLP